jgi:hypothetical protein
MTLLMPKLSNLKSPNDVEMTPSTSLATGQHIITSSEVDMYKFSSYANNHFQSIVPLVVEKKKKKGLGSRKKAQQTVLSIEERILYSQDMLNSSLLPFASSKQTELAIEISALILAFTLDDVTEYEKNADIPTHIIRCAQRITEIGLSNAPLRDEIFCQLLKQTTFHSEDGYSAALSHRGRNILEVLKQYL